MKYIITLIFLFLFMSYAGRHRNCMKQDALKSIIVDIRCDKIKTEATNRGKAIGVCRSNSAPTRSEHPDPEACRAIHAEAERKCNALPPDPDSRQAISGTRFCR